MYTLVSNIILLLIFQLEGFVSISLVRLWVGIEILVWWLFATGDVVYQDIGGQLAANKWDTLCLPLSSQDKAVYCEMFFLLTYGDMIVWGGISNSSYCAKHAGLDSEQWEYFSFS